MDFNSDIKQFGWSEGCRKLIDKLDLEIDLKLKDFPKKGSILVYSNHPTGLDPYVLGYALGRDDYIFLGDIYQANKGNEVSKHISQTASVSFWRVIFRRRPTNWPGYINMRINVPPVSKEKARIINSKAINTLVKNLNERHLSVVFPSGGEYEFLAWKKGLAKVIDVASGKKIGFTLYRVRIKNFSEFKLILHFLSGKRFFSNLEIIGYPVAFKRNFIKNGEKKLTELLKAL